MRVITGLAKGRKLDTLEGTDVVRPTSDKVKEGMFSVIQFEIEGADILDLFAGSGQLGIEALSRGARSAVFVDADKNACEMVRSNLDRAGLSKNALVKISDAKTYLGFSRDKFDIIFMDPPYNKGILNELLPLASKRAESFGWIVCESEINEVLPDEAGDFHIAKVYKYGKTKVTVYRSKGGTVL
jgi:16S rRNA (guanine966-N2)-methyltransferase